MKSFIVLILAFTATLAVPTTPYVQRRWAEFKVTHGKQYTTPIEELQRLKIFQDNLAAIEAHNEKYAKGEVTYKKAINQFGDLTKEEFLAYVNKGKASRPQFPGKNSKPFVPSGKPKAFAVDWRNQGAVAEVKDQGQCGSCWAFSAFDPAMQRYQAMKVSSYEHFKPNFKNARLGLLITVVPIVGYAYLLHVTRSNQEQKYRSGEVAYKDRDFKLI